MAGEQYLDLAVKSLLDHFEANLATQIAAVETAQSITAGSLPDPDTYIPALLENDPRSHLFTVFCEDGGEIAEEATSLDRIVTYGCVAHYEIIGDADVDAIQLTMRRILTAMINTLQADRTLGGKVVSAIDVGHGVLTETIGKAETRHSAEMSTDVTIFEN